MGSVSVAQTTAANAVAAMLRRKEGTVGTETTASVARSGSRNIA